ncbi:DNA polymerase II [Candidatus Woesearchaeota archaeon]|nr:DNA polymerase II [Candidatus Woesearchaeota archaeon]
MRGFVVYPTYRIIENKAYVYLFGKLENGESFLTINYFQPYFYIRKSDQKKAEDIQKSEKFTIKETDFFNFKKEHALKIIVDLPNQVPPLRKLFEDSNIITYEADIRFTSRFMIDHNIKGSLTIKGEHKKGNFVDRIYENPELSAADIYEAELKVASLDIETNGNATEIYCISLSTDNHTEAYITSEKEVESEHAKTFKDEKAMLEHFKERIQTIDPDIITGWNVIDFDLHVLKERMKHHKIPFVIGRADWECKIRIESDFMRESSADIAGRQVLDGIALLKNNFVKLNDYKLDTASQEILGKKKSLEFNDKRAEIEALYKNNKKALVKYNILDTKLAQQILQKKNLINITIQRSMLTGMQLERVSSSIASLDSLYLRETKKRKIVCPTAHIDDSTERIKGGYVRDSSPGIYDYVLVLDFKSLYPSIIRTFNIDPITFDKDGEIEAPNGARFRNEPAILPELIQHLWQMRDAAKKKKDDVASYAIKITMNSFFGVLANPTCRFYSLDVANAITSSGRQIVQETAEMIEKKGFPVIYGDTDSTFVLSGKKSEKETELLGEQLQKEINNYYTKLIKEKYNRASCLELEFDKVYKKFILPKIRGQETGAKKRYAGMVIENGKEEVNIVGLEFVRRDWTELAKVFQLELLNRIFNDREVQEYIKQFTEEVLSGKHDDLLVYRKAIRKEVAEYTKTTPPHVKAARLLGNELDSNVIEYVITTEGPEPIQKKSHKIDYEHYIDKQMKPIADSILCFFNTSFDELTSSKKQKTLFNY